MSEQLVMAEIARELRADGLYYVTISTKCGKYGEAGPFETQAEADRVAEDLAQTSISLGGFNVPGGLAN